MRKYLYLALLSLFLSSCAKEMDALKPNSLETMSTSTVDSVSRMTLLNDSIIPLDSTKFPKKKTQQQRLMSGDVWSSLYELNGIDVIIQSRDSWNGKNTFQTQGKGKEVILAPYSASNSAQRFHLRFPPGSSGIQYLLYSSQEQAPVGAGSYASNPNKYVLYTQPAGSTGLFGFSWDFNLNATNNSFYIKNQDLIAQGSGGMWDIYNYVLNSSNGVISFAKRNDTFAQQFNIMPDDDFIVQGVNISLEGAQILSSSPTELRSGEVLNNNQTAITRTLAFTESTTAGQSFSETAGITTRKSGSLSLGIEFLKVKLVSGSATLEKTQSQQTQYGTNNSKTTSFTESFNITIPPGYRSVYKFSVMEHSIKAGYTANLKGVRTNKLINIGGVFTGVDYTTSYLEVSEYPIGVEMRSTGAPTRTYKVFANN